MTPGTGWFLVGSLLLTNCVNAPGQGQRVSLLWEEPRDAARADVTVEVLNDFIPPPTARNFAPPPRAVYRRGAEVCLAVTVAAADDPKRALTVVAGPMASFKTATTTYELKLQSLATQLVAARPGRRGQLRVVYTGLPDVLCAGTLLLPVTVRRNDRPG